MDYRYPIAEPDIGKRELSYVSDAVQSGWVSSKGKYIKQFEEGFAKYVGTKHGVATSSGTSALHLALAALGIGPGDEVIVPTLTFAATVNAVIYVGATPVFADSHPDYWCIDPKEFESHVTRKTRAVVPVHLYGHPCDMDAINSIAREHDVTVVEDMAEAIGAEYRGKRVGSLSEIACASFYGNKMITSGEGGMCLTSDSRLADRITTLRDHGMDKKRKYWHALVGYNYRMTNMQAALGSAQLGRIEEFVEKMDAISSAYNKVFARNPKIGLPPSMAWAKPVCWLYTVLLPSLRARSQVQGRAESVGIETRRAFWPLHTMPPYKRYASGSLREGEGISRRGISLPSGHRLGLREVDFIARTVAAALNRA